MNGYLVHLRNYCVLVASIDGIGPLTFYSPAFTQSNLQMILLMRIATRLELVDFNNLPVQVGSDRI